MKARAISSRRNNEAVWFLFVVPALFFYLVFIIFPAASSVYYAFTDWNGVDARFIGFENFKEMFQDRMILTTFGNTALYSVFITLLQNILGLALALLMVKKLNGVTLMRTMFFMPAIFSSLVLGYVWNFILEPNVGVLNSLLHYFSVDVLQRAWLAEPSLAKAMIILVQVWQFAGYSMVIYIAGLQAVPPELYESGDIDGAKGFSKFRFITFPMIAPAFTINILLCTIGTLKSFDSVMALTGGGPGYETETIATMMYHLGFGGSGSRWGYGTAMAIVMFAAIMTLTALQTTILRKREVDL